MLTMQEFGMVQVTVKEHHFENEECKEPTAALSSCCVTREVVPTHRTTSIDLCGTSNAKLVKPVILHQWRENWS